MSYCPIDEAFGNFMTDGLNPDPLESSSFKSIKSNNCVKKSKIKKKKINCNRNSTSFSENQDDIYTISPDVTDDDMDFDNNLQNGYGDNIDLYTINTPPPTRNKKSKISKKKRNRATVQSNNSVNYNNSNNINNYERNENLINSMNPMNSLSRVNVYENFQNYNPNLDQNQMNNSNNKTIKKKPKITRKKPIEKNEIYEYSQEDDMPIEELREIHGIVTNEEESDSDSDLEETRPILKNSNVTKQSGGMNSQISEINNKINFIMNQISNKDNEIKESEHNNIHDIILFVIFGIFVLIILEALYRLISKMVRANTILSNNISRPVNIRPSSPSGVSRLFGSRSNSGLEGSGSGNSLISSSDTFDAVREYARSKK